MCILHILNMKLYRIDPDLDGLSHVNLIFWFLENYFRQIKVDATGILTFIIISILKSRAADFISDR